MRLRDTKNTIISIKHTFIAYESDDFLIIKSICGTETKLLYESRIKRATDLGDINEKINSVEMNL